MAGSTSSTPQAPGNNLDSRLTETEKTTAQLIGEVTQIGKVLTDLGRVLDRNREATEQGFRDLRREIRDEVAEVRQPKGQWVAILSVGIALVGLIGGPFLVYAKTTQEVLIRFEQRQHTQALEQASNTATIAERRFWLNRELDDLNASVAILEDQNERKHDQVQDRLDYLREIHQDEEGEP